MDGVGGVHNPLAFGREAEQRKEVAALSYELGQCQKQLAFVEGFQNILTDLATNLAMLAMLVLAIPLVADGKIPGVYLAFLALVVLGSFEAVAPIGTAFRCLGRSVSARERLIEIVDTRPEVEDPTSPLPQPDTHALEFDRAGFHYGPDGPPALDGISLALRLGERIAVVGPSGARKSTLVNLIKGAPLLVLDEPTANLDSVTEHELLDTVYETTWDRATLVITHRLVRMEAMDEILILNEGRVVKRGLHEELLRASGPYQRMLEVQHEMFVAS